MVLGRSRGLRCAPPGRLWFAGPEGPTTGVTYNGLGLPTNGSSPSSSPPPAAELMGAATPSTVNGFSYTVSVGHFRQSIYDTGRRSV